ncbi:hypothetical protein C8J57DRAFT_1257545 [Mycena rebaudengoi]|nr:hypothetical protein C8J57DRAFT_1257545 [Mycena rebaudengoi]
MYQPDRVQLESTCVTVGGGTLQNEALNEKIVRVVVGNVMYPKIISHRRGGLSEMFCPRAPIQRAIPDHSSASSICCILLALPFPWRTILASKSESPATRSWICHEDQTLRGRSGEIDVVTTSFVVGGAILWAVAAALDGHRGMLSYFALFGVAIEFYARTRGNVAESDHQYRVLVMTAVQRYLLSRWRRRTIEWSGKQEFDTIEQIDPHTIVGEAEGPEGGSEDEMVGGKKCGVAVNVAWDDQVAAEQVINPLRYRPMKKKTLESRIHVTVDTTVQLPSWLGKGLGDLRSGAPGQDRRNKVGQWQR